MVTYYVWASRSEERVDWGQKKFLKKVVDKE